MADPSRLARQLGAELRGLRTLAGLSQREVRDSTSLSQTNISRAERGESLLSGAETEELLRLTGADDDARERVRALTKAVHSETRDWADQLGSETHLQGQAREWEASSRLDRNCQLTMIPGLLQTWEYARSVTPQADPTGAMDHTAAVVARMDRQRVLQDGSHRFEFLIGEQALRWAPGPDVMAAQLDRLVSAGSLSTVELGILPMRRVSGLAWTNFVYREPVDGEPFVELELLHGGQALRDPGAVKLYVELWDRLWRAAAVGDAATAAIRAAL